ncbi:hypothetical protein KQI65_11305 [bacterium]|nr:hypothetical protein [bacterium]
MRSATEIQEELREQQGGVLTLSDEEINAMSTKDMQALQTEFGATVLMTLPPQERNFMQWLKEADPGVYDDLWEGDEQLLVSLSFLQDFRNGGPGFLICELEEHDNYFFTAKHIKKEGSAALEDILQKAGQGKDLAVEEALMFEIVRTPTDIWHFCHRFDIPVKRGKSAVRALVAHDWIVHLPKREDLLPYIEE